MTLPFQIANGTIQIIQQSDPNTVNLVYATWILALGTIILAIATIIGIKKSRKDARDSLLEAQQTNRLLTLELKTKFKPKLDFEDVLLNHDATDINHVFFSCKIKNIGNVSLSNILIYHIVEINKITLETMLNKASEIEETQRIVSGTLEPNRFHELPLSLEIDTRKDLWIAIWIKYEYLETIREEGIAIFYFQTPKGTGGFASMKSTGFEWFSDNDIKKAR